MRLNCPDCGALHIDEGEFASKPHHTHSCQECGMTWRPAVVHTVGVRFLPGFIALEVIRRVDSDLAAKVVAARQALLIAGCSHPADQIETYRWESDNGYGLHVCKLCLARIHYE